MQQQLSILTEQLQQLASQAESLDQRQAQWSKKPWFDTELFQSRSPYLIDYVQEAEQCLKRLKQAVASQSPSAALLASKLATQVDALSRAFETKELRALKGKTKPKTQRQKAEQLVGQLRQSTQQLYSQLSTTKGYEQRLLDMLQLEQQALSLQQSSPERVLALQARLGRCRKAISELEAQIQWAEQHQG